MVARYNIGERQPRTRHAKAVNGEIMSYGVPWWVHMLNPLLAERLEDVAKAKTNGKASNRSATGRSTTGSAGTKSRITDMQMGMSGTARGMLAPTGANLPRVTAYDPMGVSGISVYGGFVRTTERNPDWIGQNKWRTIADLVTNVSIIAASTQYFLNLVSHPKWTVHPADDNNPKAKQVAEFVEEVIHDMETPWSRVVRRAGMYRFNGFGIQEWIAKKRDDGLIGLADVEPRPAFSIEKWEISLEGQLLGVWQRSPQTFQLYGIPRNKFIYMVDDTLTDQPDGLGVFRHLAEPYSRLKQYLELEARAYERDLRGIPVGRAPITYLNQLVKNGTIKDTDRDNLLNGLRDFITTQVREKDTGIMLDSMPYESLTADGILPTGQMQWGIELLTGGVQSLAEMAKAIDRLQREMARIIGTEHLMMGDQGGNRALAVDKSRNLYLIANAVLSNIADAADHDIIDPIMTLNGFDDDLRPHFTVEDVAFKDVAQISTALFQMAQAGAVLDPNDEAIDDVRDLLGISRHKPVSAAQQAMQKPPVPGQKPNGHNAEGGPQNPNGNGQGGDGPKGKDAIDESLTPDQKAVAAGQTSGLRKYVPGYGETRTGRQMDLWLDGNAGPRYERLPTGLVWDREYQQYKTKQYPDNTDAVAKDFEEDKHPRDEHGRFTSGGGKEKAEEHPLHALLAHPEQKAEHIKLFDQTKAFLKSPPSMKAIATAVGDLSLTHALGVAQVAAIEGGVAGVVAGGLSLLGIHGMGLEVATAVGVYAVHQLAEHYGINGHTAKDLLCNSVKRLWQSSRVDNGDYQHLTYWKIDNEVIVVPSRFKDALSEFFTQLESVDVSKLKDLKKYSEDQPRDDHGRFGSGSSEGKTPEPPSGPMVFHGTSAAAIASIEKNGLQPATSGGATAAELARGPRMYNMPEGTAAVYFAATPKLALQFAEETAKATGSEPVVIPVHLSTDTAKQMMWDPKDPGNMSTQIASAISPAEIGRPAVGLAAIGELQKTWDSKWQDHKLDNAMSSGNRMDVPQYSFRSENASAVSDLMGKASNDRSILFATFFTDGNKARKYSEDQPRDNGGKWTSSGGGSFTNKDIDQGTPPNWKTDGTKAEGYSDNARMIGDKLYTDNVDDAVKALGVNQKVVLDQPEQVATLVDKLASVARQMAAEGKKAPTYDLCNVSVSGTNLFCAGNQGYSRIQMPQLKGIASEGSKAATELQPDVRGETDISGKFGDYLTSKGVDITDTSEDVSHLRASQAELNGAKVGGIAEAVRNGKLADEALLVSRDNYILDGHHRWAAQVAAELRTGQTLSTRIRRVDMNIVQLIHESKAFAKDWGLPQVAKSRTVGIVEYVKSVVKSQSDEVGDKPSLMKALLEYGKAYPTDEETYTGKRGKAHMCYSNAARKAAGDPDLTYVEGFVSVFGLPLAHAWNIDEHGVVVDPTLKSANGVDGYFGVAFKTEVLQREMQLTKKYGMFTGTENHKQIDRVLGSMKDIVAK